MEAVGTTRDRRSSSSRLRQCSRVNHKAITKAHSSSRLHSEEAGTTKAHRSSRGAGITKAHRSSSNRVIARVHRSSRVADISRAVAISRGQPIIAGSGSWITAATVAA